MYDLITIKSYEQIRFVKKKVLYILVSNWQGLYGKTALDKTEIHWVSSLYLHCKVFISRKSLRLKGAWFLVENHVLHKIPGFGPDYMVSNAIYSILLNEK